MSWFGVVEVGSDDSKVALQMKRDLEPDHFVSLFCVYVFVCCMSSVACRVVDAAVVFCISSCLHVVLLVGALIKMLNVECWLWKNKKKETCVSL
jgi:hypothetical protein